MNMSAEASPRDVEGLSLGWSFTVVHHDRNAGPAVDVLTEIDRLARSSPRFTDSHGQRDRMSWEFSGPDLPMLEALHGLVLREGPHWWAAQTTVGERS